MLELRAKRTAHGQPGQHGAITGIVTGFDGQSVTGACVTAVSGGHTLTTTAAPDGTFRLAGLAAGSYALEYRDCAAAGRYQVTWSGGAAARSNAARVQVSAGQARHVPAVMLRPVNPAAAIAARQASFRRALAASSRSLSAAAAAKTGSISGKVTGKGKPLGGICLLVTAVSGPHSYGAQTAKNGTYTIRGVAPGQYDVIFDPLGACPSRANWLQQIYKGDNSPYGGKATAVRIRAGHKTSGINADLRLGGEISGTVTGKSGAKLRGICVFADVNVGHGQFVNYQGRTAATGSYHLHALFPGKYTLFFEIGCGSRDANYAPATRRSVKVSLGQNRTANEKLAPGASITGTVTLKTSSGSTPLKGICVDASNASGSVSDFTSTNSKGEYRAIGLTAGRFQLNFSPGCHNNGNYTSVTLTAHTTAGRQTSNVDAVLQVGAVISGTIKDTDGNPVSDICIELVGNNEVSGNVGLDNGGNYTINQLPAGTYQVGFDSGCGNSGNYSPNWYDNQPSENTATPITLTTAQTFTTADAVLQPGATITGKVTNTAGHALSRVCVFATPPAEAAFGQVNEAQTSRTGTYTIPDLAPGQYSINFGCGLGRYGEQWFRGASGPASADAVSATTGRTANINAVLQPGGTIKGVVAGKAGHPLAGVCVFAVSAKDTALAGSDLIAIAGGGGQLGLTGSRGTYQISGLAAARYQVLFEPCTRSARYAEQWFRDKPSPQSATDVVVRAGKTTPGINGHLVVGGTISGHVTGNLGRPQRNICVVAASQAAGIVGGAFTGKAGTYTIHGLASGRYTVQFTPCGNQNLVTAVAHARVNAPHATTGVNAAMHPGGSIAGTVIAGSAGPPVSSTCIEVYSENSAEPVDTVITGLDGTYRATGLAAGTYLLDFGDPQCLLGAPGLAPQWYNNESTRGSAKGVPVTVGATTPSIDATLQPDGQITGTVSGPAASPLAGICVTAVPQASGSLPVVAVTRASGGYTLADLLPGDYKVRFSPGCGATGYATQWYDDAPSQSAAAPIPVGPGQTQSGINATLSKSG
jgi:Carboxypeptidase regulatory-like domain